MAGKSGGSWKVAYADFVTAMMAFFLVMWIGAQDSQIKQSVANYFVDPSGAGKAPTRSGGTPSQTPGSVSKDKSVPGGQGSKTPGGKPTNPATEAVLKWIKTSPDRHQYWKNQAQACRERAANRPGNQSKTPDELANDELAAMLSSELAAGLPPETPEVYRKIVNTSLGKVAWNTVAEDVLKS